MGWGRVCALAVFLSAWCLCGSASANEGAAALLPFQGPQAAKVRGGVQKGLRDAGVRVVPLKQVSAVAKKTKGYSKQAAKLDATVLVRARVRRVEGRWIADTEVRNAKGQRVKKLRTSSSSVTRLSGRIVTQLMKTRLMPSAAAAAAAAARPEPKPAAPTQPRVVVRSFKGAQAAKVRVAAIKGLRDQPIELYSNGAFVDEARRLGANLQSDGGHIAPSRGLAVSGLVEGDVVREDGVWSAYIRLVDGRSTDVIRQRYYESGSLSGLMRSVQGKIGTDFRKDLKSLGVLAPATVTVAPVAAAAAPPVKKDPKKDQAKVTTKQRAEPKKPKPAAVDILAEFRIVRRTLRWNEDIYGNLRDYTLNAGPGAGLRFQYFPGAHFTSGVGAQFGIDFEWERLFKIDSTRADGRTFPTSSQQFLIGLRWRYPTGRWEPFVVVDYGVHNFRFGVSGPPTAPGEDNTAGVPSVDYQFVRVGGGFRVALGKKETYIIGANVALRGVFNVGGIGTNAWFPQAKANGLDTGLFVGFALPLGFEIRIGLDFRRYWFKLNPTPPSPPYAAGGALDRYLAGTFGFAWRR